MFKIIANVEQEISSSRAEVWTNPRDSCFLFSARRSLPGSLPVEPWSCTHLLHWHAIPSDCSPVPPADPTLSASIHPTTCRTDVDVSRFEHWRLVTMKQFLSCYFGCLNYNGKNYLPKAYQFPTPLHDLFIDCTVSSLNGSKLNIRCLE